MNQLDMTNGDRLDRVENQIIDLNLAVSALVEHGNQMQENFVVVVNEIRSLRSDFVEMQSRFLDMQSQFLDMQSEIRGLQTENHRILEELQRRRNEDN